MTDAGTFEEESDCAIITINLASADDAVSLIGTVAHELFHSLLHSSRTAPDTPRDAPRLTRATEPCRTLTHRDYTANSSGKSARICPALIPCRS